MSKANIKMLDEFLNRISRLGSEFDRVAEQVLETGGEVVLEETRGKLASAIGSGTKYPSRSTGELQRALGLSRMRLNRDGNHDIKIGFSEPRSGGGSNAKIANILEYGKHGQPAKPFLKSAKTASRKSCQTAMEKKLEEEIGKLCSATRPPKPSRPAATSSPTSRRITGLRATLSTSPPPASSAAWAAASSIRTAS